MAESWTVTRETEVAAPPEAVWEHLVDFRRWRAWSPFEELDPGMERTYGGAESGAGATYAWAGNVKAGAGRMEVLEAVPASRLVVEQENRKPIRSRSTSTFTLTPRGSGTTVTWQATGPTTLMTKAMGVFTSMDKVLGPAFEKGLAGLRREVEG
jgi:uncharacterized protein YndB with AHSA1/START domain